MVVRSRRGRSVSRSSSSSRRKPHSVSARSRSRSSSRRRSTQAAATTRARATSRSRSASRRSNRSKSASRRASRSARGSRRVLRTKMGARMSTAKMARRSPRKSSKRVSFFHAKRSTGAIRKGTPVKSKNGRFFDKAGRLREATGQFAKQD